MLFGLYFEGYFFIHQLVVTSACSLEFENQKKKIVNSICGTGFEHAMCMSDSNELSVFLCFFLLKKKFRNENPSVIRIGNVTAF